MLTINLAIKNKKTLKEMRDGDLFKVIRHGYADVIFIVNRYRDIQAFSVCGNYVLHGKDPVNEFEVEEIEAELIIKQ